MPSTPPSIKSTARLQESIEAMEQGRGEQRNDHGLHLSPQAFSVSPLVASIIAKRHRRRVRRPGTKSTVHDNKSPGYGWLLPGWVAEERQMISGRIYRYYYDPSGRMYYTQAEVIRAWEDSGVILLEK